MNKPYLNKWCIANVHMHFKKLKGHVKTESGKRFIKPGERFMPLTDQLQFTFIGYADPLFEIEKEVQQ